jgi:hypothetical protein
MISVPFTLLAQKIGATLYEEIKGVEKVPIPFPTQRSEEKGEKKIESIHDGSFAWLVNNHF